MPTVIAGQPTSTEVLRTLAAEKRPIILAFSCGEGSIATWLALQDAGIKDIRPVYLYGVPNLGFVEQSIAYFQDHFGTRIAQYPHPRLYQLLNDLVYQPPERINTIRAAKLPNTTFPDHWDTIRAEQNVAPDTWVADGIHATDSPNRRMALSNHGPLITHNGKGRAVHKASPTADWYLSEARTRIHQSRIRPPVDYTWLKRIPDFTKLEQLERHAPDDHRKILDYFPLAELEIHRARMETDRCRGNHSQM